MHFEPKLATMWPPGGGNQDPPSACPPPPHSIQRTEASLGMGLSWISRSSVKDALYVRNTFAVSPVGGGQRAGPIAIGEGRGRPARRGQRRWGKRYAHHPRRVQVADSRMK